MVRMGSAVRVRQRASGNRLEIGGFPRIWFEARSVMARDVNANCQLGEPQALECTVYARPQIQCPYGTESGRRIDYPLPADSLSADRSKGRPDQGLTAIAREDVVWRVGPAVPHRWRTPDCARCCGLRGCVHQPIPAKEYRRCLRSKYFPPIANSHSARTTSCLPCAQRPLSPPGPDGWPRAWGSRGLVKLRAAVGFIFGLVAIFIGAIALVIYSYVYKARNRRPR